MRETAAKMATVSVPPTPVQDPKADPIESVPIDITLVDEAAITISELSKATGESVEDLIGTSLRLLKILADSERHGRRVVVTTRFLWPIKELFLPHP